MEKIKTHALMSATGDENLGRLGRLTLIPTPIDPHSPLEPVALNILKEASLPERANQHLFIHEEEREARRKWLRWGFPRSSIESFLYCHEQNYRESSWEILGQLQKGQQAFLMSDCGLPAFCDPGQYLVDLCHEKGILVTSTPFPNSIALSVALSGFPHHEFLFAGFLPRSEKEGRLQAMEKVLRQPLMVVLMDTPYRLEKLLHELQELTTKMKLKRRIFLAMDLNCPEEKLLRGEIGKVISEVEGIAGSSSGNKKREFVLIVESQR